MDQQQHQYQTVDDTPLWFQWAIANPGESRYFQQDGVKLHYLAWDQVGSEKPALIMVHGHRGHARWWATTAPFLAERYRVYALDLSGMGDSGYRKHYDDWTHSHEILALIDHLGEKSVYAVGHSFGGGRIMKACYLRPHSFTKLVIVDSKVFFPDDPPIAPYASPKSRLYPDLATAKSRFRLAPAQDWSEPYLMDYIAECSLKKTAEGWTWKFDPDLYVEKHSSVDGAALLSKVTVPTDIVYGDLSGVLSPENAQRNYNLLPNPGHLVRVPGGYHHLMLSHPTALIGILQALL